MTASSSTTFSHKQLAVNCFNATWDLLDLKERTKDEEEQMIHLAHTSFWHWTQVVDHTPKNLSIGYWQLSRVYAVAGNGERALYYAERCQEVSSIHMIAPFYIGYAYEALCGAYSILEKFELATQNFQLGMEYMEKVDDDSEKEMLRNDLQSIKKN